MNNLLFEKLEELSNELKNSPEIIEMLELKKKLYEDSKLSNLLNEYRKLDKYDSKVVNIKQEIISNPLIIRYRELENKLCFTILEVNKKLNALVDKKGCSNENN